DIVRIIFHYVRLPTVLAMVCKQFRHWVDQIYPIRKEDWVNLIREERDDMITYLLHQGSIIPMKSFTYNLNYELVAKHRLDQKWLKDRRSFERDVISCRNDKMKKKVELISWIFDFNALDRLMKFSIEFNRCDI